MYLFLLFFVGIIAVFPQEPLFPLDPAEYCKPNDQGQYEEKLTLANGGEKDFVWGQGGGCLFGNVQDLWNVTHKQEVMVWDKVNEFSYEILDPLPGTTHRYQVKYIVKNFIRVIWTMDWHHFILDKNEEIPTHVGINYKKISGTSFIPYWEGTILLKQIAPDVTGFAMRNQIDAYDTSSEDAQTTIQDVYDKIRLNRSLERNKSY